MMSRKYHRLIGLILFLPFIGWSVTGLIFFIKPGYDEAYEMLNIKTYPITDSIFVPAGKKWEEVKHIKTILGTHLIVKENHSYKQLNPETFEPFNLPSETEIEKLINDAVSYNKTRYGETKEISGSEIITTTGIKITLDWNSLSLYQRGKDTELIDTFYKIHYLQWTGINWLDRVLGFGGLAGVFLLALLGIKLFFNAKPEKK